MVPVQRPDTMLGRYLAFCSSLPLISSDAMAPDVRPWNISNAWLADSTYSLSAVDSTCGRPWPPYSSGADKVGQPPSHELLVGFLEAVGDAHRAVVVALAALLVADLVQGREDFGREFAALVEDRLDQVGSRVGEALQVGIIADVQHLVEDEAGFAHRRCVNGHQSLLLLSQPGCPAF